MFVFDRDSMRIGQPYTAQRVAIRICRNRRAQCIADRTGGSHDRAQCVAIGNGNEATQSVTVPVGSGRNSQGDGQQVTVQLRATRCDSDHYTGCNARNKWG